MAQIIIRIIGKHAFNSPSITDQRVMPKMLALANFSGMMPIAGTANNAKRIVTIRVTIALL
jgi:hypothetical protein